MTSRQRMLAAFRIEETDCFPLQVRGVRCWDEDWCATRHASYGPVIEAVAEHGDFELGWGVGGGMFMSASDEVTSDSETVDEGDWLLRTTTIHTPGGDMTSVHRASTRGLPGLQIEFPVKTLEDIEKVLSVPWVPPRPDCSGFFEADQALGERGIVMCSATIPVTILHALLGSDLLAIWSMTDRDVIRRLTEVFLERCLDLLDWVIEQGVGPVFCTLGEEYLAPPLAGPVDFREFVTEPGSGIGDRIHKAGGLRHLHCHGSISSMLDDFVEMGANCLHPIEAPPLGDVPFEEAKRRIGDRVCLEGNIQIGDIYHDPTDVFVEKVKRTIEVGVPGGGFILAPTASPHTEVLTAQTVSNYVAMVETAVEMRGPR
jgi:hypothetical protein